MYDTLTVKEIFQWFINILPSPITLKNLNACRELILNILNKFDENGAHITLVNKGEQPAIPSVIINKDYIEFKTINRNSWRRTPNITMNYMERFYRFMKTRLKRKLRHLAL